MFLLQLTSDQEEVEHATQMGVERPKQDTDQEGLERILTLHSRQRLENLLTSLYANLRSYKIWVIILLPA